MIYLEYGELNCMVKDESRVKNTDCYDGSYISKQRLANLFYITQGNIDEYVNYGKQYRTYLKNILNRIEEERKVSNLHDFSKTANSVLRITESKNIADLVRLLFNALTALDALKSYIYLDLIKLKHRELQFLVEELNKLFIAKCIDTNQSFDLGKFLHDVRNTYLHNGEFVAKLELIPSGEINKLVPAIAIRVNKIWNKEFLKKSNLSDDYVIDTLEVFIKYQQVFNGININDVFCKNN